MLSKSSMNRRGERSQNARTRGSQTTRERPPVLQTDNRSSFVKESAFMGRSGKRHGGKHRSDNLDRFARDQLKAFKAKFGRDPLPGEPLLFDRNKDVPTEIDLEQAFANLADSMREAGMRPELIYAYEKTGLVLMEGKDYPQDIKDEYQSAIAEYFKLKKAGKIP
jgi:hypothetical protein